MADIASVSSRRPAASVWKPTWYMRMDGGTYDLCRLFFPIILVFSSFCFQSAFLSSLAGLLLCKEFALFLIWVIVFGSSSVNFCCSHKHWPNLILLAPVQYRTTEAELFYLHHLCSSAASARGSRSTSSSGTTKVYFVSDVMRFAYRCDGFVRWFAYRCDGFVRWAAETYGKALWMYSACRLCGPGTMRWQTAVALASGHPVLATALFEAFTLSHPFELFASGALRLACAHAAWITIVLGVHAPQLWQCRAISALFSALFCSESVLSEAISAIHSWDFPAFPPKMTAERIQEKLVGLRAYVANHADVMRLRPGATVLEKIRQTASHEEYKLYQ